jgi:hypothetical protein
MPQSEQAIQQGIILAHSKGPTRLLRNNCGQCQTSDGRVIRYGVGNPGGSDLIGLHTVTITQDMVGQRLAVFTAIEVKTPTGRATEQQNRFIAMVKNLGGIAGVARSVDDASEILRAHLPHQGGLYPKPSPPPARLL